MLDGDSPRGGPKRRMTDHYDVHGSDEGMFEPGSNEQVLRNLVGITDPERMEGLEFDLLEILQSLLYDEIDVDETITCAHLRDWHRRWLGNLYSWAGQHRRVNLSKDGFPFMLAGKIDDAMAEYERDLLMAWTPCLDLSEDQLIEALAICHVELILIHPFRDGNGRIARLLATIMALQAGLPQLDFSLMDAEKEHYITAIHAGMGCDYGPMQAIFREIVAASMRE